VNREHRAWWLGLTLVVLLVASGVAFAVRGPLASGSSTATVTIESGSAVPGGSDTVRLEAIGVPAPGLGASTIDISYDPSVISPLSCANDPNDLFDMALCNLAYQPNVVRFSALRSTAGATGTLPLADITYQAIGQAGECSSLGVALVTFSDPDGTPIAHVVQDGQYCIPAPSPSPSPTGTGTATATATTTATLTPTRTASPTPSPTPTPTPTGPDDDGDGLPNSVDPCPNDDDCDDDGLMDGAASSEDLNNNGVVDPGETNPENWDTDGDGLSDGLEEGLTAPEGDDTNTASPHWQADSDASTLTDPLSADTDGDAVPDGQEDANHNGKMDAGETDAALVATSLVQGWSQACYVGASASVGQALGAVAGQVLAVYRLGSAQTFDRWFPGRPEVSTIVTLSPYDQVLVLTSESVTWGQQFSGSSQGSAAMVKGWNAVCYGGATTDMDTATAGMSGQFSVIYALEADQTWGRYVPGRPDVSDMTQCARLDALLVLVTAEDGAIWIFNP